MDADSFGCYLNQVEYTYVEHLQRFELTDLPKGISSEPGIAVVYIGDILLTERHLRCLSD